MERLAQDETYYPSQMEGHTGVTAMAFGVCRLPDGYWYDFNDTTFKNSAWTTPFQSMAEEANPDGSGQGLWIYTTGWAVPDANSTYQVFFKITDGTGTYYQPGPKIVVNDAYVYKVGDIQTEIEENGASILDTLQDRLTAARAGYLDNLSAGAVALASICTEARLAELDVGTAGKMAEQIDKMMIALVNKMVVTEASGNTEQFSDAGVSLGSIAAAFATDGTYTTRKRLVQ